MDKSYFVYIMASKKMERCMWSNLNLVKRIYEHKNNMLKIHQEIPHSRLSYYEILMMQEDKAREATKWWKRN